MPLWSLGRYRYRQFRHGGIGTSSRAIRGFCEGVNCDLLSLNGIYYEGCRPMNTQFQIIAQKFQKNASKAIISREKKLSSNPLARL